MRQRRRGALAALLLLLLVALPTPAAAHLWLVSSEPADGAHLTAVPHEIRMRFSEPVELAFTRLELLGPDGSPVRLSEPSVPEGRQPNVLVVRIEDTVAPGPYSLVWRTTSADGHPVRGRVGFSVDEDAAGLAGAVADQPPVVSPVHHDPATFPEADGFSAESPGFVVVRWLTFIGLLGVIGVVAFKLIVLGLVRRRRAPEGLALMGPATQRSATLGVTFSLLLVVAVLARFYAQSLALHGAEGALEWASISAVLTRTTWGVGWILQAAATAIVLAGFVIARHRSQGAVPYTAEGHGSPHRAGAARAREPGVSEAAYGGGYSSSGAGTGVAEHDAPALHGGKHRRDNSGMEVGWVLAALGALVLAFTPALGGHALATPERTWLAVLSDGLHVLGAGGWLGGLLAVLAVGVPVAMRLGKERRGRAVAALVNAFSPAALFFAALVTATGVLSASFHLGSFADLWQSDYGRTLLLKVGVLSLLFGTGAYNWLRLRPALGADEGAHRLRRSAGFELAVGVVVLLITAVLVATPPPIDMRSAAEHAAVEASR
jgi:copper transport protein